MLAHTVLFLLRALQVDIGLGAHEDSALISSSTVSYPM